MRSMPIVGQVACQLRARSTAGVGFRPTPSYDSMLVFQISHPRVRYLKPNLDDASVAISEATNGVNAAFGDAPRTKLSSKIRVVAMCISQAMRGRAQSTHSMHACMTLPSEKRRLRATRPSSRASTCPSPYLSRVGAILRVRLTESQIRCPSMPQERSWEECCHNVSCDN